MSAPTLRRTEAKAFFGESIYGPLCKPTCTLFCDGITCGQQLARGAAHDTDYWMISHFKIFAVFLLVCPRQTRCKALMCLCLGLMRSQ